MAIGINLGDEYNEPVLGTKPTFDMGDLVADEDYRYKGKGFNYKLPLGFPPFDIALGGGLPLGGAIIEVWGEESHGKTTLTYRACKRVTDMHGYVTWIDNESSYDEGWATVQGLNVQAVIPYRPPYMEKAIEIIIGDVNKYKEKFLPWTMHSGRGSWKPTKEQAEAAGTGVTDVEGVKEWMTKNAPPHVIVWDTIANCPVKTVVEGQEFGGGMALRARLIKSFITRFQVAAEGCEKLALILINQVIENIGDQWNPLTTPGGRGLRHGKHLSIFVKKSGGEKDEHNFASTNYVTLSLTKNKVTPVIGSFPIVFSKSKGFIGATSLLEYLMFTKWFRDSGSWKKFDMPIFDEEGEMTGEFEEKGIQRGTFYKLVEDEPKVMDYLCSVIKDQFVEKFPFNKALRETDVEAVLYACRNEETSMPEEGEESVFQEPKVQVPEPEED